MPVGRRATGSNGAWPQLAQAAAQRRATHPQQDGRGYQKVQATCVEEEVEEAETSQVCLPAAATGDTAAGGTAAVGATRAAAVGVAVEAAVVGGGGRGCAEGAAGRRRGGEGCEEDG